MATNPVDYLAALGGLQSMPGSYAIGRRVENDQLNTQIGQQQVQAGQQQIDAATTARARQQQGQLALQAAIKDGRPDALANVIAQYPEYSKQIKEAHDLKNAAAQKADLGVIGQTLSALDNGKIDLALQNMKARRDAEKAAGEDVSDDDRLIAQLETKDPAAVKTVQGALRFAFGSIDPAKFAENYKIAAGTAGEEFSNTPQGDIYSKRTGEVTHAAGPKPIVETQKVFDENGNVVGSRRVTLGTATAPTGAEIEQAALSAVPGAMVTSRGRTPEKNAAVGGVPNSYHLSDEARDMVPPPGMSMAAFHNALQTSMPGMKVLNEGDHVHIQPVARRQSAGFMAKPATPAGKSSLLDADTISMMADQYLAGDKTVFQNLGRGAQGSENIVKLRKTVAARAKVNGMTGADIAAQMADFAGTMSAERTVGTRIANVEMAASEAQRFIPLALDASAKFKRSGILTVAQLGNRYANQTNDPTYRTFVAANNALVNAYARAVSPTGAPAISDKDHARELLNVGFDNDSYAATVQQLNKEITAARQAPREVRKDIRSQVSSGGQQPTRTATNPKTGQKIGLVNGAWVPLS